MLSICLWVIAVYTTVATISNISRKQAQYKPAVIALALVLAAFEVVVCVLAALALS